ncbi:antitoxin Xre/MbcA/ParS toxin-binding domain-containing protein [Azospirillum melinis]
MFTCSVQADTKAAGRRPNDVQLAYGEARDGRILHVTEVPSGLACGCVCPGCKGVLVAHKGEERAHHFVHHAPSSCTGAYESALHKLAKQLISERGLITTPAIVARHGDEERALRAETVFRPDSVVLEKGMDGIRPDVIARKGDRALLVEIAVTHFCGPEKIALIQGRQLAAIEIDLRTVPHDAPKDVLEDAILFSAPRYWLFNRHEAGAVARMQAEEERRKAEAQAREERQRQQRLAKVNREADRLAMAYRQRFNHVPPGPKTAESVLRVLDAGLDHLLAPGIPGTVSFSVSATAWQSVVLDRFFLAEQAFYDPAFRGADVWKVLSDQGLIRPEFMLYVDDELAEATRNRLPDFHAPYETVTAFLQALETRGLLYHAGNRWRRVGHGIRDARERLQKAIQGRTRVDSLRSALLALLAELPDGHGVNPDHWMRTVHPGMDGAPADQAMASEWSFHAMVDHLRRLRLMRQPGSPVVEELHGLPLEREREMRREERRVADEAKQRQREEQARKQAEESRRAAIERRQAMVDHATSMLGYEDARRWLAVPLSALGGVSVNELEGLTAAQQETAYKALRIEQHRLIETDRRRAVAEQSCEDLLCEAERVLGTRELAELWMRQKNPLLGNRRPLEMCVDTISKDACVMALKAAKRPVKR